MIKFDHLKHSRLTSRVDDKDPGNMTIELAVVVSATQDIRRSVIDNATDPSLARRMILASLLAALWKGLMVPCDEAMARRVDLLSDVKSQLLECDIAPEDLADMLEALQSYILPMAIKPKETEEVVATLAPKIDTLFENA